MSEAPRGAPEETYVKRHPVLLVDDERNVLESLQESLRKHPFEIFLATSGADALALLARRPIELVVSDERMPAMSGSQLMEVICRDYPDTMRIMLSGQASLAAVLRAINEGEVHRFLTKPFSAAQLAEVMRGALALREQRLEVQAQAQPTVVAAGRTKLAPAPMAPKAGAGCVVIDEAELNFNTVTSDIQAELARLSGLVR